MLSAHIHFRASNLIGMLVRNFSLNSRCRIEGGKTLSKWAKASNTTQSTACNTCTKPKGLGPGTYSVCEPVARTIYGHRRSRRNYISECVCKAGKEQGSGNSGFAGSRARHSKESFQHPSCSRLYKDGVFTHRHRLKDYVANHYKIMLVFKAR